MLLSNYLSFYSYAFEGITNVVKKLIHYVIKMQYYKK